MTACAVEFVPFSNSLLFLRGVLFGEIVLTFSEDDSPVQGADMDSANSSAL